MVAQLKEVGREPDELESFDDALEEVTRRFVEADARRGSLHHRMMELRQGRDELRRHRARTALDAYLPPLTIYSFERVTVPQPPPPRREALPVLFFSVIDVLCIWWGKYFGRRAHA